MNKIIKYIFLAIVLSSCTPYGSIILQTTKPAEFHIPNGAKSICFAIRQPMTKSYKDLVRSDKKYKNINKEVLKYYDISFEGFYDKINKTKRFDRIMHYRIEPEIVEDSTELKALNWIRAGQISSRTGADILIILEDAKLFANMNPSRTKYIFSWDYTFRIYDTYSFKILEIVRIVDADIFSSRIEGFSVDSELEWDAYKVGQQYANRLIPSQEKVERLYYNKGNALIKLGTYYLKNKDYQKTMSIWKRALYETKELELKYKIYLNLALVEELNGNLSKALIFAKSSLQFLYKTKYSKEDQALVKKRIADLKLRIEDNIILNQ